MFKDFFKNNTALKLLLLFINTTLIFNYVYTFNNRSLLHIENSNQIVLVSTRESLYFKSLLTLTLLFFCIFIFFLNKNILRLNSAKIKLSYFIIAINSTILIFTESILTFFITYEMVLVPSAFLVYFYSPNKRSYLVTIYFLL